MCHKPANFRDEGQRLLPASLPKGMGGQISGWMWGFSGDLCLQLELNQDLLPASGPLVNLNWLNFFNIPFLHRFFHVNIPGLKKSW